MTLWSDNTLNIAREGMLAEAPFPAEIESSVAEGTIRAGLLVARSIAEPCSAVTAVQALPAADPNGITATALVSAAAETHYAPALYDGVIGADRIHPPQRVMVTLNAHADWLDSAMSILGEGPDGRMLVEDLFIPAGGNTILYTHGVFSVIHDIWIPAQGGVNGTALIGVDPTYYGIDKRGFPGIAVYDRMAEPSATTTVTFDDEDSVSVIRRGRVWVTVEAAVTAGDPAYVRMVEVATDLRGQFRGSPATNFCRLPGAHFISTQAAADGLAKLEIGG